MQLIGAVACSRSIWNPAGGTWTEIRQLNSVKTGRSFIRKRSAQQQLSPER